MEQIIRGESKILSCVAYTDTDNLIPADITGSTIKFMLKATQNDPDSVAVITKTSGAGITGLIPYANGAFEVALTAAELNTLSYNIMFYEIIVKLATGTFIRTGIVPVQILGNVLKTLY